MTIFYPIKIKKLRQIRKLLRVNGKIRNCLILDPLQTIIIIIIIIIIEKNVDEFGEVMY